MLVKLRGYEEPLIIYIDDISNLCLSWNDKSGRTLQLINYNNDLTYKNYKEYDIIIIYSLGPFYEPYTMDTKNRYIVWRRDTINVFSLDERMKAISIKGIFDSLCNEKEDIIIERINPDFLNIKNKSISMTIPDIIFPNLHIDKLPLDAIIIDEILQ